MKDIVSFYVYDKNRRLVGIADAYSSLIWSDRFDECGDFELVIPYKYASQNYTDFLKQDYYCGIDCSDRKMIIEKIEYKNEEESAPEMIITGRSLESILERRIVTSKTVFGSDSSFVNVQSSIQSLITAHIINPSDTNRRIANFVFKSNDDPRITSLSFSGTYNGDDLLKIVSNVCQEKKIGFKLIFDSNWNMTFELYAGTDHSYSQSSNNFVVFSPGYDNLKSSDYSTSVEKYKNVMYIAISENVYATAFASEPQVTGIDRREIAVDSSELKENESTNLSNSELSVKARQKLLVDYKKETSFEAEIVPGVLYEYGKDYEVGDRVQLSDIYGNTETVYISEVIISCDQNGVSIIPTFENI